MQNKKEDVIHTLEKALPVFQEYKANIYIARVYTLLGSTNTYLHKQELATEQLLKALSIVKEIENKKLEANIYSSLAHLYFNFSEFDKAIEFLNQTSTIQIAINDSENLSATYNNMAVIYKNTNRLKEAISYNLKSLHINKEQNNAYGLSMSYNNLGLVEALLDHHDKAKNYYQRAIAINEKNNLLNSNPLRNLGVLYMKKNKLSKAKTVYSKALTIEKESKSLNIISDIYSQLGIIAKAQNDYQSALNYITKADSVNKVLSDIKAEDEILSLKNQYEFTLKETELRQEVEDTKKTQLILFIIFGIVILITLALLQKNKINMLELEKEKIRLEQSVLRSQMNPHFIFNALTAIQNSLHKNDIIKSSGYIAKFAKLIRQNFDFISKKTITLADELNSLHNYLDTQLIRYKDKFDYEVKLDKDIKPLEVEVPPMLIQPFIENAIEHGFKNKKEKGEISITVSEEEHKLNFTLQDNGNGDFNNDKIKSGHSTDIFVKRLKLLGNGDEKSFNISSSESGTIIKFSITIC